jgi:hypothetical protein
VRILVYCVLLLLVYYVVSYLVYCVERFLVSSEALATTPLPASSLYAPSKAYQIKASSGPDVWPVFWFLGTRGLAADQHRHDNHAGAGVVAAFVVVVAVVVAVGPVGLVIVIVRGGAPRDGFRLTTDQRDGALCLLFLEGLPYYIFSASVKTYQVSTGGRIHSPSETR